MFHSQYSQDKYIHDAFFKEKDDGFFVDLGASDGVKFSNTLFFEESGWNGLCIEARKSEFLKLAKNRKCILENCCISGNPGKEDFIEVFGYGGGLSGILRNVDVNRIYEKDAKKSKKEIIKVNTVCINNLLKKHNIKNIDYFSIDIEGSEYEILNSLDFDFFNVFCFSIENNKKDDCLEIMDFMMSKGYRLETRLNIDEVYVKS